MVADQVTFIQSYKYNLYAVWGVLHCTSRQYTTHNRLYVRQHRADQGRHKPGWQGPLHLPQDFGWRWGTKKLKKKPEFWRTKPLKTLKKKQKNEVQMVPMVQMVQKHLNMRKTCNIRGCPEAADELAGNSRGLAGSSRWAGRKQQTS